MTRHEMEEILYDLVVTGYTVGKRGLKRDEGERVAWELASAVLGRIDDRMEYAPPDTNDDTTAAA